MKARGSKELKANNPQDLEVKLNDLKAELFSLRSQLATGQLENPVGIREVKRSVTQIKTIIREEEVGAFEQQIRKEITLNGKRIKKEKNR